MNAFDEIEIDKILISKTNPRTHFDDLLIKELAQSVKTHGVLQPILVRPKKGKHELVCGERRIRASKLAGLKKIPCHIKDMTDEQALEAQIIENLQRKDVHPLDEATAFKGWADQGKDIKEIASRVGKSEYYARQRMRLCSLSLDWQTAYYNDRISASVALSLSTYDDDTQNIMWKDHARSGTGLITINSYTFNNYKGDLLKASFDINDPSLDKKMGPCSGCQFNSAHATLFPESAQNPKCTKVSCFSTKSEKHFQIALKSAKSDPEVVFVNPEYSGYSDNLTRQLEKDGFAYYNGIHTHTFEVISEPDQPDPDDYDVEDYDSEEEIKQAIQDDMVNYEEELAEYKEKISGGKYKKAFVIHGSQKGKYVFLNIKKAGTKSSAATKAKETSDKLSLDDINGEIKRLQEREKRNKELDVNKVHKLILDDLAKLPGLKTPSRVMMDMTDRAIMIYILIYETPGVYSAKEKIKKELKIKDRPYNNNKGYDFELFKKLGNITDIELAFIIRTIALEKWGSKNFNTDVSTPDTTMALIADYSGIDIKAHKKLQQSESLKREERVNKRIAELQQKKKELAKKKTAIAIATKDDKAMDATQFVKNRSNGREK